MTAEGNRSTGTNHLRGYVDAVEILDESVDVSPTLSVGHDEMPYDTPPTSPSYAASQDDKSQSVPGNGESDTHLDQSNLNTKMSSAECPQLNSVAGLKIKAVSATNGSGDDGCVSQSLVHVSGDSASDVVESHLCCQNNVLNLSEESVARSTGSHGSQPELVRDENVTLPVPSTALQTMKRADSLPSSLLRSSQAGNSSCQAGTEVEQLVEVATDADTDRARDGLDSLNDLQSPHKEAAKLSKSKKRSTDRKRKGSSWYNPTRNLVLSPTYKSRSEDFKRIFKDIPDTGRLIVDYSCALQKDILVQGRLYISREFVCFYANIFRWETILSIRCKDIVKVTKEKTARVIPNAIQICTKDDKYFFTSFGTRDKTFLMLERVWKNGASDQPMSQQELWQWVHYSYGEELGLTSDDDADYVSMSAVDRIQFQMRIQREEKLSQQNTDAVTHHVDISSNKDGEGVIESSTLAVDASELDLSATDNMSLATSAADDVWLASSVDVDSSCCLQVPTVAGTGAERDRSTDIEDSTEDEQTDRLCCDHAHFSIASFDELLNIPVDTVFEHYFTDSVLFRDFVAAMKMSDLILSPWPDDADSSGMKVRNISYTLSLNYTIGPKCSPSTERQILYPESRPGQFYLIDTECVNGGIPYGENFYVVNRFCIARVSSSKCRLRITSQIKYRKNVWGIVKSFIEKNASAGIVNTFTVLGELLRQESLRQMEMAVSKRSSLSRKKVLRRRRTSDRGGSKRPSVADHPHGSSSKQVTPVKRVPFRAEKAVDEWHVKLTADVIVRVVIIVLVLLMSVNAALLYKLWSLESHTTIQLLSRQHHYHSHTGLYHKHIIRDGDSPLTNAEWAALLDQQQQLHETEMHQWKAVLSNTIQLMDHMVHTLSDLRASIDHAYHFDSTAGMHAADTTEPDSNT